MVYNYPNAYLSTKVYNTSLLLKYSDTDCSCHNLKEVMIDVEHDSITLVEWFHDNFLTLNADKCHFIASGHNIINIIL